MKISHLIAACLAALLVAACGSPGPDSSPSAEGEHGAAGPPAEVVKGPHGGRLMEQDGLAVELAIFETGVPPELHAWVSNQGEPVAPEDVDLTVTLTRLGGVVENISFAPRADFLRGDTVVYEQHSFRVAIAARHDGKQYQWAYDSFEGRTRIGADIAASFGLETEVAGPATILDTVEVFGKVTPNREQQRAVTARFDGTIRSVRVSTGDKVSKGQTLATIESNESLNTYTLTSPIDGIVTQRSANPGEQTAGRELFSILDAGTVWAELAVFPSDLPRVREGARVTVHANSGRHVQKGKISRIATVAEPNQSVLVRVVLDNADNQLVPGTYVTGQIQVAEYEVPLAVKRSALQTYRDSPVVYTQVGDEYEVRMLELGRQDAEWAEVKSGLASGAAYVSTNSYLIKADIEKSGAAHDH